MKISFLLFFISLSIFSFSGETVQIKDKVQMVFTEWPPFEFSNGTNVTGCNVAVIQAVFRDLGIPVDIRSYPWKRCQELAKQGAVDCIFSFGKNKDREAFVIFPEEPINLSRNVFFFRGNEHFRFNNLTNLAGKKIALTAGYYYGKEFMESTEFVKDIGPDDIINFRKLKERRVDLFICDEMVGTYLIRQLGLEKEFSYDKNALSEIRMYVGFSRKVPGNGELSIRFSDQLKKLKSSGGYYKILNRYLPK